MMTRAQKLYLIYRHTHSDYRGFFSGTKTRSILVLREGGTHLVALEDLTEEEIESRLPYAMKREGMPCE